jgi:hypothetical protein
MTLRVRSGADIRLADAFALPGCPLCRERRRNESAYLESILAESVNDVAFRRGLDGARGFCARHSRAVLDADRRRSGMLGAAILLRATLEIRIRELDAAHASGGRGRAKRLEAAARPPACPACGRMASADLVQVESLVRMAADVAWAEAIAVAPLCHDHLLALAAHRPPVPAWPSIEARQVARLRAMSAELAGYAHASSHDRRDLITDAQRASVDQAAAHLGGDGATAHPGEGDDDRPRDGGATGEGGAS